MATNNMKTQFFPPPSRRPAQQPPAAQSPPAGDAYAPQELYFPAAPTAVRRPFFSRRGLLLGALLAIMLALGTAVAGGGLLLYYSNLIAPRAEVLGIDVGAQTRAEAARTIESQWRQRTITLTAGEAAWQVHPQDLGVTLDAAGTAENAYAQSRSRAALAQLVRGGRIIVQPAWQIDMSVADAFLRSKEGELIVPAQDARIEIVNGQVNEIPAQPGQALDVAATSAWLMQNGAQAMVDGRFELITTEVLPAVTDVSALAGQARRLLTTTITVRAYDPVNDEAVSWQIGPSVWGDWLSLSANAAAAQQFEWTLDEGRADAFFSERMAALGGGRFIDSAAAVQQAAQTIQAGETAVSLRIYHPDRQHQVRPGETFASIGRDAGIPYPWIQQANPGVGDSLSVGQTITIPSPDNLIPLPVVENKRVIVSISQQRVWVYEDGALKWEWLASTGIDSSPTAPGIFQVQSHEPNAYAGNWNLWMPNFMGIYRPVPTSEFMNGFHGFPTRDGANLLWTNNLGSKVTYGCILLSNENAQLLYNWAEEGVIVEIRP